MKETKVTENIVKLLCTCKEVPLIDYESSLFSKKNRFHAEDLAYTLIELQKIYGFSFEEMVRTISEYSVNGISDCIVSLIK